MVRYISDQVRSNVLLKSFNLQRYSHTRHNTASTRARQTYTDLKIDKKNSEVESSQVPKVQLLNLICFLIIEPQK